MDEDTKDMIEAAQGNLILIGMKLSKGDNDAAKEFAGLTASFLASAGQTGLSKEANNLLASIEKENIEDARALLSDLQSKVSALLNE